VVQKLGRGGMAEVYKAYQTTLDRHVALKVILPFLTADPEFLQRFEREAKGVAALRHPNIVQMIDYEVEGALPYMVMEFIEGDTLRGLLEKLARRGQTLGATHAVRLIRDVAAALAYAHKQGVVHRDVKPANVMIDKSGRVILTDFGVAKIVGGQTLTATGAATGTPAYMSPEQATGQPADHRADIYALGVMLFEMLTGQVPFDADTPLAVMLKHAHDVRPSPRALRPDLPEGLDHIVLKCMARNPGERFQSADELIQFLNNPAAAAQLAIPVSSTTAGDLKELPPALLEQSAPLPAALQPTAPSPHLKPPEDVARSLHHTLNEIACYNCGGAGLELQEDGRVVCQFCSELNAMAGPVCPQCDRVNAPEAPLCEVCRLALTRTCPDCETRNWSGAQHCLKCGRTLDRLSALMERHEDPGERFHKERRELAAVAARDAEGSQKRMEHLEDIERQRQNAIAEARRRKEREQRVALSLLGLFVVAVIVVLIIAALYFR
jgi:serine/threonine-protein kinase